MSYYKKYRKNQKELKCLLENDSNIGEKNKMPVQSKEFCVPLKELQESTIKNITVSSMNVSEGLTEENLFIDNELSLHLTENQLSGSHNNDFGYLESPESSDIDLDSVHTAEGDDLGERIASWAIKYNCTRDCTNDLLKILREKGHDLPKDCRSLFNTPRIVKYKEKCGGSYLYLGIRSGVVRILDSISLKVNEISLDVNIDGLPLFKSSKLQLWPILGSFIGSNVFVIGLFSGTSKPDCVNEFMEDFILEVNELKQTPITFGDRQIKFSLKSFICDAPARSFLKCIISHNGYFSCERCVVKGTWNNRVTFNDKVLFPQRCEVDFHRNMYEDHQTNVSPLLKIDGFFCIKQFPLEYMHLVCLGVTKRMLIFWRQGPRQCRFSNQQKEVLSANLTALNGKMPSEFSRQPRSLDELDRWKATEYRQFLLYTGPLVLRDLLHKEVYQHFLSFHVAISILLNENTEFRKFYTNFAKDLLQFFVMNADRFFGDTFAVYNVHALLHLCEDVDNFNSSLNDISAFKFENFMQNLKRMVRNGSNPVSQIAKRLSEKNNQELILSRKNTCSLQFRDSCFQCGEKFYFLKQRVDNERYICNTIKIKYLESFYKEPFDSKHLLISFTKNLNFIPTEEHTVSKEKLIRKVCVLPWKGGYVFLPLLHEIEK